MNTEFFQGNWCTTNTPEFRGDSEMQMIILTCPPYVFSVERYKHRNILSTLILTTEKKTFNYIWRTPPLHFTEENGMSEDLEKKTYASAKIAVSSIHKLPEMDTPNWLSHRKRSEHAWECWNKIPSSHTPQGLGLWEPTKLLNNVPKNLSSMLNHQILINAFEWNTFGHFFFTSW